MRRRGDSWMWVLGPAAAIAGALVALGACAAPGSSWDIVIPCEEVVPTTIRGMQIEPGVGEAFTISLCAYPEEGIAWDDILRYDEDVLQLVDRRLEPIGDAPYPGATAARFEFRVIGPGGSDVFIADRPPSGDPDKVASTFALYVLVR